MSGALDLGSASVVSIGIGNMGFPIAGHVGAACRNIVVVDTEPARLELAEAEGFRTAAIDDVRGEAFDIVVTSLGSPSVLTDILTGPSSILASREGVLVVDVGTTGPGHSLSLHREIAVMGSRFVDAPVSGGTAGAVSGTLVAMVGSAAGADPLLDELLATFCSEVRHMGGPGLGAGMKLANNALAIGTLALAGDVLSLVEAAGIDPSVALQVIASSSGDSRILRSRHEMLLAHDYSQPSFDIRLALKDVRLAVEFATEQGRNVPMLKLTVALLESIVASTDGPTDLAAAGDPTFREHSSVAAGHSA